MALLNTMTFKCNELFAGALWFVPTILLAIGLFGGIVYIARKLSKNERNVKYAVIVILSALYGLLGVCLNEKKLTLNYHIHTAFLVIPICTMGYFTKEYIEKLTNLKKWYIAVPVMILSVLFLLYIIIKKEMKIELASENIINCYMFYIVSIVGICFCLSLATIIEKIPVLNKALELCGKHSFSIMALHFACAKGVDVIYSKIINETDPYIISKWVTSYPEKLWILYIFIGCIIPVLFSVIIEHIKNNKYCIERIKDEE